MEPAWVASLSRWRNADFFPSFFSDLRLSIEKEPLDWLTLVEEAYRRHLEIPLYYGLHQVALLNLSIGIPAAVIQQLAPSTMAQQTLELFFR